MTLNVKGRKYQQSKKKMDSWENGQNLFLVHLLNNCQPNIYIWHFNAEWERNDTLNKEIKMISGKYTSNCFVGVRTILCMYFGTKVVSCCSKSSSFCVSGFCLLKRGRRRINKVFSGSLFGVEALSTRNLELSQFSEEI